MTLSRGEPPGVAARASQFLIRWRGRLLEAARLGPVLDVACGDGRNGLHLAWFGARVVMLDRSEEALAGLKELGRPENALFARMDLETQDPPSFGDGLFGAVLVFRYLHRPLVPALKACLKPGGVFVWETFLEGQEAYGKPRNPEHLLQKGELAAWFSDFQVLELFEGVLDDPPRIMGRAACVKNLPVASRPGP